MPSLKVFNPVAQNVETRFEPAARVADLNGKRIGLFWNMKQGGDAALRATEEFLKKKYPRATFAYYAGDAGLTYRHVTAGTADRIARECDVILGTTGD